MAFADCAQISWLFKPKKHPGYHSALKLGCLQLALSNEPRNTIMFKKSLQSTMPNTSKKRSNNNNITFSHVMWHDLISEDVLCKQKDKTIGL